MRNQSVGKLRNMNAINDKVNLCHGYYFDVLQLIFKMK